MPNNQKNLWFLTSELPSEFRTMLRTTSEKYTVRTCSLLRDAFKILETTYLCRKRESRKINQQKTDLVSSVSPSVQHGWSHSRLAWRCPCADALEVTLSGFRINDGDNLGSKISYVTWNGGRRHNMHPGIGGKRQTSSIHQGLLLF